MKSNHRPTCLYLHNWRAMQEVISLPEGTLNLNIAKELIWRRNAPYFYQTLYTQELEWPSLCVEWWINESENRN